MLSSVGYSFTTSVTRLNSCVYNSPSQTQPDMHAAMNKCNSWQLHLFFNVWSSASVLRNTTTS